MTTTPSLPEQRRAAVDATLADVRQLMADGTPDRAALATVTARLEALAAQKSLFTRADFPLPDATEFQPSQVAA